MKLLWAYFSLILLSGCSIGKSSFSPAKKYSPGELKEDYNIYQSILEQAHPGLYWYTPKDSMDYFFKHGAEQLKDSLTEPQFRKILTYVTSQMHCGHTTVRSSKAMSNYRDTSTLKLFPLSIKTWDKATVVTTNLNRRDSILKRGTVLHSINGRPMQWIYDTLFRFISSDGNNKTHKYQTLSNRGYFGSLYSYLFGLSDRYVIEYTDSAGTNGIISVPVYDQSMDTLGRARRTQPITLPRPEEKPSRREIRRGLLSSVRQLRIDSVNHTAFMELNSFGRGYRLKNFFRKSFRFLRKNNIGHLIVDIRSNGGGSVTNSTFLTRFIADERFKIADSLYAFRKKVKHGRYIQHDFFNRLFMTFLTKRKSDGYYHFGYFERHYFKPKRKNHFSGKTYILTGGNSFSASTLFATAIMNQEDVTVVGEETGGAAYGNTAWLIPDVTLPNTKLRFRLPLFRLVIDKNIPKDGKGVQPEEQALPTVHDVRRGADFKLDKALELINKDKGGR